MSTPLNELPLKTSDTANSTELDDPTIQNVLKDFENELSGSSNNEKNSQIIAPTINDNINHNINSELNNNIPHQYTHQYIKPENYYQKPIINFEKNILDINIAIKSIIIIIIIIIVNYSNIFKYVENKLPEYISKYLNNNNTYLNLGLLFGIFYVLMYLNYL
tara:strand:- start:302 stop:787 length:486 start_codon:yes stop_codon:yes gene_type:complete